MHVSGLFIYPLKSAKGMAVERLELDGFGARLDRRWMLVDEAGKFLSQRSCPRMALIDIALESDHLRVGAPGMPACRVPVALLSADPSIEVEIWSRHCKATYVGADVDRWFSAFLQRPCRLVCMPLGADGSAAPVPQERPRSFVDSSALHVITQASLDALNAKLHTPVSMERFRPNIVISGAQAHAEDRWRSIMVGSLEIDMVKPCPRCAIPSVDPQSAKVGKEPLRTLASYRKVGPEIEFGQNVRHRRAGALRVGDAVTVLSEAAVGAGSA